MASFALQKFEAMMQDGGQSPGKGGSARPRAGGSRLASSLADRFESPEVKAAKKKKQEEETRRFFEEEKKRQVRRDR